MPRKLLPIPLGDMLFGPVRIVRDNESNNLNMTNMLRRSGVPLVFVRENASDNLAMLVPSDEVRAAVDSLPNIQREVIASRYGFNGSEQSLDNIGQRLHMTKQAVQYHEKAGLGKLKRKFEQQFAPS
jgi:DNA-directed RNA polymerase specialized sigma24 family protein